MDQALVDSNVILDVVEDDPKWVEWSVSALEEYGSSHQLVINPIIYAEVSIGFERIEELEAMLETARFRVVSIPREASFLAGKAFIRYKRRKGAKVSPLPDFFVGAHAAVAAIPLITRDTKRLASYFPKLHLVSPRTRV